MPPPQRPPEGEIVIGDPDLNEDARRFSEFAMMEPFGDTTEARETKMVKEAPDFEAELVLEAQRRDAAEGLPFAVELSEVLESEDIPGGDSPALAEATGADMTGAGQSAAAASTLDASAGDVGGPS